VAIPERTQRELAAHSDDAEQRAGLRFERRAAPKDPNWNGALIVGEYKLILGRQTYGFWQAPIYPNATTNHSAEEPFDCGVVGCLFDIVADPSEYTDVASTQPAKYPPS
tara:strand:- start:336 stop:662 length:327 start_codon:yes stop_codon:yes gene_type:complete